MSVSIDGYGFKLGKKSERLVIKKSGGEKVWEFSLENLSDIFVLRNGSYISTDLIAEAAARGISIHIMEHSGKPVAQVESPNLTATIETRRAQLLSQNTGRGNNLAAAFASGKALNQSRLLRHFGKYLREAKPEIHTETHKASLALLKIRKQIQALETAEGDKNFRATLMGLEGSAANLYWGAVGEILKGKIDFPGRQHRGASDPINSMLNYGYGILYAQVWGAVLRAGLEPYAGFLHVDRPGKPSLILDLVEEFRAPVVDRTVISCANLGQIASLKDGLLTQPSRVELADRVLKRMESRETVGGKSFQIRSIIQMQARQVASFLRRRHERYKPFRFKW